MNNKQLKRLYRTYNRKFFKNKLPDIPVRFGKIDNGSIGVTSFIGQDSDYHAQPAIITISKQIKNWRYVPRMVLLHEMCHVSLPIRVTHGPRFQSRMRALAKARAFDGIW